MITKVKLKGQPEPVQMVAAFPAPDDAWEQRVDHVPHLEGVGTVGGATAVDVIARLDGRPGWAVRARFEPRNGVLALTQHETRSMPPESVYAIVGDVGVLQPPGDNAEPLTQKLIRQVGLGGVEDRVKALLTDPVVRTRLLGPGWERPKVRRGHSQQDLHTYARWANRYVWALSEDARSPIRKIIAADASQGVVRTETQVRGMVNRARDRGLLTRTTVDGVRGPSGRAGGVLTDPARALLLELGIAEASDHIVTETSTT